MVRIEYVWELINGDDDIMIPARLEDDNATPAASDDDDESTILTEENVGEHIPTDGVMSHLEIEVDKGIEDDERTLCSEKVESIQDDKRTPCAERDEGTVGSVQQEYPYIISPHLQGKGMILIYPAFSIRFKSDDGSNDNLSGRTQLRTVEAEAKTKAALGLALLQAIRNGAERRAIELVEKGADPDSKDSYGFAITQAVRAGYLKLARMLLERGANPNVRDSYGYAILQAIRAGYEEFAIELVEKGADPDSKDSYGFAITQAVRAGYLKLAWKLLERGANPNVRDTYGYAILQAIRAGYEAFAIELIEKGADPDSKDSYGFAFTQAVSGGGLAKLEKVLLERGAVAPPQTQMSSDTNRITIYGDIPHGTRLKISTGDRIVQITGSDHGMTVRSVSANIHGV
jgi:ankyrin repeat protein